jgi:hypothetical protein
MVSNRETLVGLSAGLVPEHHETIPDDLTRVQPVPLLPPRPKREETDEHEPLQSSNALTKEEVPVFTSVVPTKPKYFGLIFFLLGIALGLTIATPIVKHRIQRGVEIVKSWWKPG